MMRRHWLVASCVGLISAAGAWGCGGGGGSGANTGGTTGTGGAGGAGSGAQQVEMFSWWTAPGEAEALQALVNLNKTTHPTDRLINAALASGAAAHDVLAQRLAADSPPDLFQINVAELGAFITANPTALAPLDDFFVAQNFNTTILAEALGKVTVDGKVYAMPVNMHRENAFFYNKQIFKDHGLAPPTTVAEFLDVCAKLKAAGVTPVSTAYQNWILRIMFNSLAMGSMGTEAFHDFMSGGVGHEAALANAIELMDNVLTNYIDVTRASGANFGWTDAATEVKEGRAAMFFHGDWAKGFYVQLGSTPGVDFGVVAAPGTSDFFWYGIDAFSLPAHAKNVSGAKGFFQTIGSLDGQVAFNKLKGSSPIRTDVDATKLDTEGQHTLADLKAATYRMQVVGKSAWDDAHLAFATNHDKAALAAAYAANPPSP